MHKNRLVFVALARKQFKVNLWSIIESGLSKSDKRLITLNFSLLFKTKIHEYWTTA